MSKRGEGKHFPHLDLFIVERFEVLGSSVSNDRMLGEVGLEHHFARDLASACTACDLGEELKNVLTGAEIGDVEAAVEADHSD